MRLSTRSPARRRAWLAGRIVALAAIAVAGTLAIAHFASPGQVIAGGSGQSAAAARAQTEATTAATLPARAAMPARSAAPAAAAAAAAPSSGSPAGTGSASAASGGSGGSGGSGAAAAPSYFRTLPPGAKLPSSAQCARWVRAHPRPESKKANRKANHATGQHLPASFFAAGDSPQAGQQLAPRVNGNFTGTTIDILRWAACKWGISQNVVFAQAAVESWWQQGTLGDWGTDASACPPGHKLGADGTAGQCPQSYGILQNRYPFEQASWPGIGRSTAMNADTAYAIWRSCYDGYEVWLNNVPHGRTYHKGDLWGCVGRWFAGRWHTAPAQQYIKKVRSYEHQKIWLTKDFQQN
jgi:autotransporter family porin